MQIRIDTSTPIPPFEQVRAQLALAVAAGRLRPGERLPTVRSLATDLDVAPNTIARAYRELIRSGIAEAAGRRGTFIADSPPVAHDVATRSERLIAAADEFAAAVDDQNATVDEAIEAVLHAIRRLR